ncbi:SMI1/KNR4 family protein [Rhodococcus rhodochrous]|uniref:SMI1/KNR4 family protein n=1 Tax=Rhodococcus rhodochrous TaxID=1829 RepID=UPI0006C8AAAB|nr:SMI1/KNR4 family protein [Rhodococcus rhodochrous]
MSCWHAALGKNTLRTGDAVDRAAAMDAVLGEGRHAVRATEGAAVEDMAYVKIGDELGNVSGFIDLNLGSDELRARIEKACARMHERTAALEGATQTSSPPVVAPPVLSSTPAGSVTEPWDRIEQWLGAHLPEVTIIGASVGSIERAVEATEVTGPQELVDLFGHIGGFPRDAWVQLFPVHELFDLDRMVDERRLELEVWGELDEDAGAEPLAGSAAGEAVETFVSEFVPFAGRDGNLLFVDTRPGSRYGCVTEFDKVGAEDVGPRWVSISALLAELADSLEHGTVFDGCWAPTVADGRLEWHYQQ